MRLSQETANRLILLYLYGYRTVSYYRLSIVRVKPELVVSNGDVLKGWGFIHFLIGVSLWISASVIVFPLLFKHVTPDWWKKELSGGSTIQPGVVGIGALLVMFFCIPALLSFWAAMAMGSAGLAVGLYWLRVRPGTT